MIKKNVVGIIFKNKKLLLQLRDDKKDIIFPNSWGFFGGEVNINEDHYKAIKRELYEELNIKKFKKLKFINSHFNSKYRCIFFIYSCTLFSPMSVILFNVADFIADMLKFFVTAIIVTKSGYGLNLIMSDFISFNA